MDIGYTSALYGTFQQSNNRMSYDNNVCPEKIVQFFSNSYAFFPQHTIHCLTHAGTVYKMLFEKKITDSYNFNVWAYKLFMLYIKSN